MDNLTHTLVGVAMGEAGLRRKLGKGTTLLLAVASNLPDADVVLSFADVPDPHLLRRMFTHNVFAIPILAALLAAAWARWRTQQRFRTWFLVALLGIGVHVFLDLVNSYGVVLVWPLSEARLELAWVFIIDLVLWAFLLAPNVLRLTPLRRRSNVVRWYQVSLVLVALWVGACAAGRWRGEALLAREVTEGGLTPSFTYVFPEPLGPHRWRGVALDGATWHVFLLDVVRGDAREVERHATAADDPRVAALRATPRVARLEWFYKAPVWTLDPETGEARVFDLRFRSIVLDRGGVPFGESFALPPE